MTRFSRYILFVVSALLALSAFEMPASAAPADKSKATSEARQRPAKAKAKSSRSKGGYFIEFRSRYALSYGHSFVIFGRMSPSGKMINPEVAGLHPKSNSVVPYMLGHIIPVPAETGASDGDLEDEYKSANWRVMVSKPEYDKVVAYIRKKQKSSPVWHAAVYNCNAFAADIARFMGYKTPNIWLMPQDFMTKLREWNGGPNAIGSTGPRG
jgi:hypothetical protein